MVKGGSWLAMIPHCRRAGGEAGGARREEVGSSLSQEPGKVTWPRKSPPSPSKEQRDKDGAPEQFTER